MTVEPVQRNGSMSSSSAEPSAKTSHIATARSRSTVLGQADERVPDRRQERARLVAEDRPEAIGREDQRRSPALRLDDGHRRAAPRRRLHDRRLIDRPPAQVLQGGARGASRHRCPSGPAVRARRAPTSARRRCRTRSRRPGGTRRWIGAACAGNGWRTRLSSGRIDGATSDQGPLGSNPANASIARRIITGSTAPPSGRISQSPCRGATGPCPSVARGAPPWPPSSRAGPWSSSCPAS